MQNPVATCALLFIGAVESMLWVSLGRAMRLLLGTGGSSGCDRGCDHWLTGVQNGEVQGALSFQTGGLNPVIRSKS